MIPAHSQHFTKSAFFITGGTLPNDALCYVERAADEQLFTSLMEGSFCYVLTSRQMGKSSLMIRTAARLDTEGIRTAIIDLTSLGQHLTVLQWYYGMLLQMGEQLGQEDNVRSMWHTHSERAPIQRFISTIRDTLLQDDPRPLVIFIDEIDVVNSLPFPTDEFFAAIRECCNRRQYDPTWSQVTFCLLGVAAPSDLIKDSHITPFNIGTRIDLEDFTADEAGVLAAGLAVSIPGLGPNSMDSSKRMLNRILYWSGGHPYLTQRLCTAVVGCAGANTQTVDRECHRLYFDAIAGERDDNIQFVRDRLIRRYSEDPDKAIKSIVATLDLYRRVRMGRRVAANIADPTTMLLLLSGIVMSRKGLLRVRNRIYHRVFNLRWIADRLPHAEIRRRRAHYVRGYAYGTIGTLAVMAAAIAILTTSQERLYRARQDNARMTLDRGVYHLLAGERGGLRNLVDAAHQADAKSALGSSIINIWNGWYAYHSSRLQSEVDLKAPVQCLSASPDGQWIAAGFRDRRIALVSTKNPSIVETGLIPSNSPIEIQFNRDGSRIAYRTADGIYVVGLSQRSTARRTPGARSYLSTGATDGCAFTRDGKQLITWSNSSVSLWDLGTDKKVGAFRPGSSVLCAIPIEQPHSVLVVTPVSAEVWRWGGLPAKVHSQVFESRMGGALSPTTRRFTAGGGLVRLSRAQFRWLTESIQRSTERDDELISLCIDGSIILATSREDRFQIESFPANSVAPQASNVSAPIESLLLSADGQSLLVFASNQVYIWDIPSQRFRCVLPRTARGPWEATDRSASRLLQCNGLGVLRVWGITHDARIKRLPSERFIEAMAITDSDRLVALSGSGAVEWDIGAKTPHATWLSRRPFGQWSALAPYGGAYADVKPGKLFLSDDFGGSNLKPLSLHSALSARAFSADGKRFAVGTIDGKISVYSSDRPTTTPRGLIVPAPAEELSFSEDGRKLLIVCQTGVYVTELDSGVRTTRCSPMARPAKFFDSAGRKVLVAGVDGELILYETRTRKTTYLGKHDAAINALATAPSGETYGVGLADGSVQLYHADRGTPRVVVSPGLQSIREIRFSNDARRVFVISLQAQVSVHDAHTGHPLAPPFELTGTIGDLRLSRDGESVCWSIDRDAYAVQFKQRSSDVVSMRRETSQLLDLD